jgi:hypothetical protein
MYCGGAMPSICDLYSKGIKKKLRNYWAAWLPSTRYALGDIGLLNGYVFEKRGSLRGLRIPYSTSTSDNSSPLELVSGSGVSVKLKASGEVNEAFGSVPQGKAGIKIEFGEEGAFVVQCPQTFESAIPDLMALQTDVLQAFEMGRWDADWSVIVRLVSAPLGTILISNSSNAQLELSADLDLTAGIADLGKSQAGIAVGSYSGDMIKMIGAEQLTPFFQIATVKKRLFGGAVMGVRSMRGSEESGNAATKPHPHDDPGVLYLDMVEDDEDLVGD